MFNVSKVNLAGGAPKNTLGFGLTNFGKLMARTVYVYDTHRKDYLREPSISRRLFTYCSEINYYAHKPRTQKPRNSPPQTKKHLSAVRTLTALYSPMRCI